MKLSNEPVGGMPVCTNDFFDDHAVASGATDIYFSREEGKHRAALGWSTNCFESLFNKMDAILTCSERRYIETLAPLRQRSFLLGRDAAKRALARLHGAIEPYRFEIRNGVFSQPVVAQYGDSIPIEISITHESNQAFCIASPATHPMAVDVESIDVNKYETLVSQMSKAELSMANTLGCGEMVAATAFWTAKEALSKVLRCGLTCPFSMFELKAINMIEGIIQGEYESFAQYRFTTKVIAGNSALTLVYPKRSRIYYIL